MRIDSIRQWQWVLIALAIGFAVGYLRQQFDDDLGEKYGSEINSQARFEKALVETEKGKPHFTSIYVLRRQLRDRNGITKDVSIVSGSYFDGRYVSHDGRLDPIYAPAFFVAPIAYKPASDVLRGGDGRAESKFAKVVNPTVNDFLDALTPMGVRYSRSWFAGLRMWQWVTLSVVLIGIAWPITINLLVFGSWRRPREEKGIDLSKVQIPQSAPGKDAISDEDMAQVAAMADDLEQALSTDAVTGLNESKNTETSKVRDLATSAVVIHGPTEHDNAEYGAKPDDFYPTAKITPVERKK